MGRNLHGFVNEASAPEGLNKCWYLGKWEQGEDLLCEEKLTEEDKDTAGAGGLRTGGIRRTVRVWGYICPSTEEKSGAEGNPLTNGRWVK